MVLPEDSNNPIVDALREITESLDRSTATLNRIAISFKEKGFVIKSSAPNSKPITRLAGLAKADQIIIATSECLRICRQTS